jgi:hypothetical protein
MPGSLAARRLPMATAVEVITTPASTRGKPDRIRTRTVKGEKVTETKCRFCESWQPVDKAHFYPHRASGGFHVNSRCVACDRAYRAGVREATKAGTHRVVPRKRDEVPAEAAEAGKSAPKPTTQPTELTGTVVKRGSKYHHEIRRGDEIISSRVSEHRYRFFNSPGRRVPRGAVYSNKSGDVEIREVES